MDLSCFRFGGGVKAGSGTGLLPALQRGGRWACDAGAALRCFAVTADPFCDVPCRSSPLRSSGCGVFVGAAFLAVRVPTFCSLRSVSCRIVLGAYRPLLQRVSSRSSPLRPAASSRDASAPRSRLATPGCAASAHRSRLTAPDRDASVCRFRLAAPSCDVSWRPLLSHNWGLQQK